MNQTQKSFALTRIFNIFTDKADKLMKVDIEKTDIYEENTRITLGKAITDIKAGVLKTLPRTKLDLTNLVGRVYLTDIYDMEAYKKHVDQGFAVPEYKYKHETVRLMHPINNNRIKIYYPSYTVTADKIKKIQEALYTTADAIMLGDDKEALAAIKAAENYSG